MDDPPGGIHRTVSELGAEALMELFVGLFGVFAAELCEHHAEAKLPHFDSEAEAGGRLAGLIFVHM